MQCNRLNFSRIFSEVNGLVRVQIIADLVNQAGKNGRVIFSTVFIWKLTWWTKMSCFSQTLRMHKEDWKLFPYCSAQRVWVILPRIRLLFSVERNFRDFWRGFCLVEFGAMERKKERWISFRCLLFCYLILVAMKRFATLEIPHIFDEFIWNGWRVIFHQESLS